jgi:Glycosyl transferase family 2
MSGFDITVAITAHAESLEAGPALRSAEAAIAAVEARGATVERLIGFDCAEARTLAFFDHPSLSQWKHLRFTFADQGATRNALAKAAKGRYLAFLDADDMFSENWLLRAYERLESSVGSKRIVHPELIWQFDGADTVYTQPSQDSPFFTPHHFAIQNYYDALCMGPTQAWREVKFPGRDIATGYAYEDWQWSVETMAAGWQHVAEPDTVLFKRRRDASQSQQARSRKVSIRNIPALAIDKIKALGREKSR